jgi:hypothetical protein
MDVETMTMRHMHNMKENRLSFPLVLLYHLNAGEVPYCLWIHSVNNRIPL